jgi:hypothetical protein
MPVTRMSNEDAYNQYQGFHDPGEGSSRRPPPTSSYTTQPHPLAGEAFDIFAWHAAYLSCQKYFLDHSQHETHVQAVAALLNIQLPFQWPLNPLANFGNASVDLASPTARFGQPTSTRPTVSSPNRANPIPQPPRPAINQPNNVSLIPYLRRFVITGWDTEPILHGFFGDDWRQGIGHLRACERRNYLFAAKAGGWEKVKSQYDMDANQTVPWLQAPQNVKSAEIESAEQTWSSWLALEDWMIGPRAPGIEEDGAEGSHGG